LFIFYGFTLPVDNIAKSGVDSQNSGLGLTIAATIALLVVIALCIIAIRAVYRNYKRDD
jgi:hypothetical protein